MKKFFKDLWGYYKDGFRFCKKHWFGTFVIETVFCTTALAPIVIPVIKGKIEERKSKKN